MPPDLDNVENIRKLLDYHIVEYRENLIYEESSGVSAEIILFKNDDTHSNLLETDDLLIAAYAYSSSLNNLDDFLFALDQLLNVPKSNIKDNELALQILVCIANTLSQKESPEKFCFLLNSDGVESQMSEEYKDAVKDNISRKIFTMAIAHDESLSIKLATFLATVSATELRKQPQDAYNFFVL